MQRILLLEDEKLNADRLQRLLKELRPTAVIVAVLSSVKKAVAWLSENEAPDLILMDIHLSDGLSFEIFHLVTISAPVVFTTAHDAYALKAFQYNSIDYLLKPVVVTDLERSLVKYEHNKQSVPPANIEKLIAQLQPKEYRNRFLLPHKEGYLKINTEDIAYFNSQLNITYARLFDGTQVIVPQTLEVLEQEVSPKSFYRINRQYIVHINAIEKVDNYFNGKLKLQIKNCQDTAILVSRLKAPLFKNWLDY